MNYVQQLIKIYLEKLDTFTGHRRCSHWLVDVLVIHVTAGKLPWKTTEQIGGTFWRNIKAIGLFQRIQSNRQWSLVAINTAMYFKIPANIVIYLFVIVIALIQLSRCGSFVTVTEDEAVQLEFPYPCDSNKVTYRAQTDFHFTIRKSQNL